MKFFSFALLATLLAGVVQGQLAPSGTHFAEEALKSFVEKGEMPGAISIFYKDGKHEVACLGYANAETTRPIALDNVYMQCSQTKGFCGVTIAILVEEGKIALEDPVSKYLPEFATLWIEAANSNGVRTLVKAKNVLRIRDVMNHTGGFPFELPNGQERGGHGRIAADQVRTRHPGLVFECRHRHRRGGRRGGHGQALGDVPQGARPGSARHGEHGLLAHRFPA